MTTYPRDRFGYSSPFTRPPLKLPGKGRIIVWSVVNIEEWEITRPMARQLSIAPQGQSAIPDMPNWTWYEYGMRVGFWRLMRALKKAKVTPTMSLNAKVCETYPEATAAARDAGWEFLAHSYVQMPIQQIAEITTPIANARKKAPQRNLRGSGGGVLNCLCGNGGG